LLRSYLNISYVVRIVIACTEAGHAKEIIKLIPGTVAAATPPLPIDDVQLLLSLALKTINEKSANYFIDLVYHSVNFECTKYKTNERQTFAACSVVEI
jgi:hypothetical protein